MNSGEIFDEKYKILDIIGHGGMGTVYLAQHIKLQTLWAIKELKKDEAGALDLLTEANILKKLNHSALPRIFDIVEDEKHIYVIVDYIEGKTLQSILEEKGRIEEEVVLDWVKQLCDVLSYLHSFKPNPIIYRDMKPSNIMLTKDQMIKLIDFGIAREYKEKSENDTIYIGTRGYAAPEQYGMGQTSPATDIYSLGVTMHELLTGKNPNQQPFELKPVRYYNSNVSKGMEFIIWKCTRPNPNERYQSVKELLHDLNNIKLLELSDKNREQQEQPDEDKRRTYFREKVISFKKLILTVLDNSEFACEFAYILAKATNLRVLIIDIDFTDPKLDLYLNITDALNDRTNRRYDDNGIRGVDAAAKNDRLSYEVFERACIKLKGINNLHILTEPYDANNLELSELIDIKKIVEAAYQFYDVTIIVTEKSIENHLTNTVLPMSDFYIAAVRPNTDELRSSQRYMEYVKENFNIPNTKFKLIAYEYIDKVSLPVSVINRIFPGNIFMGCISYQKHREKFRNINSFYAKWAYKLVRKEYIQILHQFKIIPKPTLGMKTGEFFSKVLSGIHSSLRKSAR